MSEAMVAFCLSTVRCSSMRRLRSMRSSASSLFTVCESCSHTSAIEAPSPSPDCPSGVESQSVVLMVMP